MNRIFAAAVALALLPVSGASAGDAASVPTAAVITYVTSGTVYLDAGTEAGIRKGDVVKVFRDGEFVTALEVSAVATKRAACRRSESAEVLVGDSVRFRRTFADPVDAVTPSPVVPARPAGQESWLRQLGLQGRIGVRYLGLFDGTGYGEDYSQPALDLRLRATSPGHESLHFSTDVRARRTYRTPAEGESRAENRTRVYRLAAEWNTPGSGFRAAVGRQASTALIAVGIFDGVSAELGRNRWRMGAFSGTQPDPIDFGFSQDIREHGVFVEWRDRAQGRSAWRLTGGLIGSYTEGEINREHLTFQGRYTGRKLFGSAIQDVDVNRGWKSEAGESALSLTSSFVSLRLRATEKATFDGGVDTRRTVRLYRNRETPETDFDDTYRQGTWGGVDYHLLRSTTLGLHVRRTTGGGPGSADAVTITGRTGAPRLRNLTARVRSTGYTNDTVKGWLHSFGAGLDVGGRAHLDLGGGLRNEADDTGATTGDDLHWYSADVDYRLTRLWVLLLSLEQTEGENERSRQIFVTGLYRF